MEWAVIFEPDNLALFGNGILITVWLLAASLAVGGVLALIFALMLTGPWAPLRWLVGAYTFVIRGTPLLIQVYLIYYGLGQLEWIQERWNDVWPWTYFKEPFFCALLAFSLNTAGYTAEMLAGAIRETSAGEIEAAHAYGMNRFQTMLRIVLPSAMRRTLPAYSNEVVMMLHATSLASVVPALYDLTNAAYAIYKTYYLAFQPFIVVAVLYFILTFALIYVFRRLEKRFLAYLRPRTN